MPRSEAFTATRPPSLTATTGTRGHRWFPSNRHSPRSSAKIGTGVDDRDPAEPASSSKATSVGAAHTL
nr:hypothetical protein [Mycolicibacterium sp.]